MPRLPRVLALAHLEAGVLLIDDEDAAAAAYYLGAGHLLKGAD